MLRLSQLRAGSRRRVPTKQHLIPSTHLVSPIRIQHTSFHTSSVQQKNLRQKTKKKEGDDDDEEALPVQEERVKRADEGDTDEEKTAKDLAALKANSTALEDSDTPLAKWIRQDKYLEERERLRDIMDRVKERYPEAAEAADKYISSLSTGYILQEMQREYPEIAMNKLTDLEVFDFLNQFIPEKERNPSFQHVRKFLEKEEKARRERSQTERQIDADEAAALASHFPALHQNLSDTISIDSERKVAVSDPALFNDSHGATMELFQRIMKPYDPADPEPIDKSKFFEGIDKNDKEAWEMRNRMYNKYIEVLRLSRMSESLAERTPEEEPLIEAATNFRQIFRPSSIGKYVRFASREQRKYLTEGFCGKLEHREFEMTKEFSLLFREPSLQGVNKLKKAEATSFGRDCPKPTVYYGEAGVGKSSCLQFPVYWARKSNWIVVNIRNATKWAHSGGQITKSKLIPGCWDQPYLGVKFLGQMLDSHAEQLKQIPLRTQFTLGKFEGKTLFDLVEYGAALHEFACDAIVHFRRELERVIEFPVLIAIDDYNSLYNYNQVFRDPESPKFKAPKLKNSQLTLCHIFMDVHKNPKLVNGTFIGAVSREVSYRNFPIEEHRNEDWIHVPNYSLYETQKVFQHYERTGFVLAKTSTGTQGVLHQLNSGRGHELWKWARTM